MQGGVGGGSGNVATLLFALNQLSGLEIDELILQEWSSRISSDAPFFFSGGRAYVTGRGEKVRSLDPQGSDSFYLAKPDKIAVSTPRVYAHWRPEHHFIEPREHIDFNHFGINDLEIPAFALYPELKEAKQKLLSLGFEVVGMSGSGSSFFCVGSIARPQIGGFQFWKVSSIFRKPGRWYTL